ncbi:MAG: trypsin-like peptidase domain-containing protein [bacterium]
MGRLLLRLLPVATLAVGVGVGLALPHLRAPGPREVTPRGDLAPDEQATIALFSRTAPSVVYITTLELVRDVVTLDVGAAPQGSGSGFIWDQDGHVVTNYHVLGGAVVQVTLYDQSVWPARVVGASPEKDLAVLRIDAPADRLSPVAVGTSADLQVGQRVLAIGNPFGLDHSLTTGVVSAVGRTMRAVGGRTIHGVVQTDASINPGNSGGPLLDSAGRLIGVNTAIKSPTGASAGIGFAVPVDTVRRVVPQLIAHGRIIRPRLGLEAADDALARRFGLDGVLLLNVEPDGPAAAAGLQGTRRAPGGLLLGDVIVGLGGFTVKSSDDLLRALENHDPGDRVEVVYRRDGVTGRATLELQPPRLE